MFGRARSGGATLAGALVLPRRAAPRSAHIRSEAWFWLLIEAVSKLDEIIIAEREPIARPPKGLASRGPDRVQGQ